MGDSGEDTDEDELDDVTVGVSMERKGLVAKLPGTMVCNLPAFATFVVETLPGNVVGGEGRYKLLVLGLDGGLASRAGGVLGLVAALGPFACPRLDVEEESPSSSLLRMTLDGSLSMGVSTGNRHSGHRKPGSAAAPSAWGRPLSTRSLMHGTQKVC